MTALAVFAVCSVVCSILISIYLYLEYRSVKELLSQRESVLDSTEETLEAVRIELEKLQNKFQKNPSYECQQLLANLLSGHALFHIETIDPENILLRRR